MGFFFREGRVKKNKHSSNLTAKQAKVKQSIPQFTQTGTHASTHPHKHRPSRSEYTSKIGTFAGQFSSIFSGVFTQFSSFTFACVTTPVTTTRLPTSCHQHPASADGSNSGPACPLTLALHGGSAHGQQQGAQQDEQEVGDPAHLVSERPGKPLESSRSAEAPVRWARVCV